MKRMLLFNIFRKIWHYYFDIELRVNIAVVIAAIIANKSNNIKKIKKILSVVVYNVLKIILPLLTILVKKKIVEKSILLKLIQGLLLNNILA